MNNASNEALDIFNIELSDEAGYDIFATIAINKLKISNTPDPKMK